MLAATVPPVKLMLVEPPVAVTLPPQPFTRPGVADTTSPVGRLSLNASPFSVIAFELVILNVNVVLPFKGIVAAANVFSRFGGATTVRFAEEVFPGPPSFEFTGEVVFV